jgi:hypothetical protein
MNRILNLLRSRRARLERDLDRELRYHFDRRVADMVAAGLSETEARRRAAIELGATSRSRKTCARPGSGAGAATR